MKQYYEELWAGLPEALEPPDFRARRELLTAACRPGDRVLDLGCGEGTFTPPGAVGVEVAESALARARRKHPDATYVLAPLDGPLPLQDGSFDLVWASEVIEHVADTQRWLEEVRRVLTHNGRLLLTTPNHTRIKLAIHGIGRYSQPFGDHLHLYNKRSLAQALTETGFGNVRVSGGRMLVATAVHG
jgi:ubiquinone/menaquinone biosynthesis C-methylase UbiE